MKYNVHVKVLILSPSLFIESRTYNLQKPTILNLIIRTRLTERRIKSSWEHIELQLLCVQSDITFLKEHAIIIREKQT